MEDRWNHNSGQIKTSRNTLTHTLLKQTTKKLDCISSKILYFDLVTELQDATKAKSMAMSGIKSKHQEMVFCFQNLFPKFVPTYCEKKNSSDQKNL